MTIDLQKETIDALKMSLEVMYEIWIKQPIENFPDKLGEAMQQCQAVLDIIEEKNSRKDEFKIHEEDFEKYNREKIDGIEKETEEILSKW